ncbi:MAG: pantoate--beta-alanine ligase [Acidobacteria bacterium]|nr:MAG: pantoate--beta-alanine ligase [Acidobacteriota bacterium]
MRLITTVREMKSLARETHAQGKSLALVPTMGALHDGHLSLVRRAKRACNVVVVSIFVNPTQFGPGEDLARYPRNLEKDLSLLAPLEVGVAFAPGVADVYPAGFDSFVEPGALAAALEGASRPGHFRGVATVVLKLLNIVRPDAVCFGQKDFQQALLIRHLVEDLNLDVRLVICPIVREPDGLAKSSRNAYLSPQDRQAALALYHSLQRAQELADAGETDAGMVVEEMKRVFAAEPRIALDYAVLVNPARLEPVERVTAGCVALVAARIDATRLIDNWIIAPPGTSDEARIQLALARGREA